MEDLPANHPLYRSEQSKSGFGICYQFAIKCPVSALRPQCFQGFAGFVSYSHSIRRQTGRVLHRDPQARWKYSNDNRHHQQWPGWLWNHSRGHIHLQGSRRAVLLRRYYHVFHHWLEYRQQDYYHSKRCRTQIADPEHGPEDKTKSEPLGFGLCFVYSSFGAVSSNFLAR